MDKVGKKLEKKINQEVLKLCKEAGERFNREIEVFEGCEGYMEWRKACVKFFEDIVNENESKCHNANVKEKFVIIKSYPFTTEAVPYCTKCNEPCAIVKVKGKDK